MGVDFTVLSFCKLPQDLICPQTSPVRYWEAAKVSKWDGKVWKITENMEERKMNPT